ncbi:short chain dehydrogenase family protein, partial [Chlamydia psittaci 84-8471/1]
YFSK